MYLLYHSVTAYTTFRLSVHLLVDIWVVSNHFFTIVNSAAANFPCKLFDSLLPILWGMYQGVELPDGVIIRCLTYRNPQAEVSLQHALRELCFPQTKLMNLPGPFFPFPGR